MFRPSLLPSLLHHLSQLPVVSLQSFELLLGDLGCSHVSTFEGVGVNSFVRVRHESLVGGVLDDGEPNLLSLANVPVAHLVEVNEAHVVAVNVAHLLTSHLDLAAHEVLRLHPVSARLVVPFNLVCFVCEGDLSSELVTHVAHENVEYVVAGVVEPDLGSVLEADLFVAVCKQVGRLHTHFDMVLGPARQSVVAIGSIDLEVRDGWVVTRLLHVNVCTVLASGLKGFSQNRIQRLFKDLLFVEE